MWAETVADSCDDAVREYDSAEPVGVDVLDGSSNGASLGTG